MLKWIKGRFVGYEVFFLQDGRWILELVTDDEATAIATARRALGSGKTASARVVRQRSMLTGFTTETVIFEETVVLPERPITVFSPTQPTPLCTTAEEICGDAGRRVVGQVLKDYLGRNNLTATELLHSWSHARRLQDKAGIITAAIHRTASAQAAGSGTPVKDRVKALIDLVDEAMRMGRDFASERKRLPPFEGRGIAAYSAALMDRAGAERHAYVLRSMLAIWLFDIRSLAGKLEAVLELMEEPEVEGPLARLLDGIAADTLIFVEVIQELFGPRANLGEFLCVLGALLQGREVQGVAPAAVRLGHLMAADRAPACRDVLQARLAQELSSDKPLDKNQSEAEGPLLDLLTKVLCPEPGTVFGGEAVQKALSARRLRHRQAVLRAQGLHAIADNLRPD